MSQQSRYSVTPVIDPRTLELAGKALESLGASGLGLSGLNLGPAGALPAPELE